MKIAVCLSGQPRTVKYCIKTMQQWYGLNADYFCHAWNYNDYKIKKDNYPVQWIREFVNSDEFYDTVKILNPKIVKVDDASVLGTTLFPWHSMLYSTMMANYFKSEYERQNEFKYDLVVKTRYDVAYPIGNFIPSMRIGNSDTYHPQFDLFTLHNEHMPLEYDHINISDVTFYGSSWAMDAATDLYWYAKSKYSQQRIDDMQFFGPGTLMSEYTNINNLRFCVDHNIKEIIYRVDAIPLDPSVDYEKIQEIHTGIYK